MNNYFYVPIYLSITFVLFRQNINTFEMHIDVHKILVDKTFKVTSNKKSR